MGWEALLQWGPDAVRLERLAGGVANDVWSVRVRGERAVGRVPRFGVRSDADLAWELGLLRHLSRNGVCVPLPVPADDGRLFVDGLVVLTWVDGDPPATADDWARVADTLREVHRLTRGWPQRPGWRSSTDLLTADTGTRVDLRRMPAAGVAACRTAWARLAGRATCAVHGNAESPGNVRITPERVGLIDWDEAHVDVPDLDLVLPGNAAGLDPAALDTASQAFSAWAAAVCWDDDFSRECLAAVRPAAAPSA